MRTWHSHLPVAGAYVISCEQVLSADLGTLPQWPWGYCCDWLLESTGQGPRNGTRGTPSCCENQSKPTRCNSSDPALCPSSQPPSRGRRCGGQGDACGAMWAEQDTGVSVPLASKSTYCLACCCQRPGKAKDKEVLC